MKAQALVAATLAFVLVAAASPGVGAPSGEKIDPRLAAGLAGEGPHRVVVTTEGAPQAAADAARAAGATVVWEYTLIDAFAAEATASVVERLAAREDVRRVWLDRPVTAVMDVSHLAIEADKAWAAGYDGSGVTVAVLDTGIDMLHPFFSGAVVSCVSTIGGLVSPECADSDGHGTHVAGTVASRDDRWPGVAPGASLAVVRVLHVLGAGLSSDIIAGMEWVADNKDRVSPPIRVATMSIGYLDPGCGDDSNPDAQAANALVAAGVTFTVAAGNSGHEQCTVDGASAASGVITVGAVDDLGTVTQADDLIADFSSGGPTKDGRVKPEIVFPGVGITSAFIGAGTLVATMSGTSMSTPHAAGTAALLLQKEPALTPDDVKERMKATAVSNGNTGSLPNNVYGWGLGNACTALQLSGCGTSGEPAVSVHVAAIDMSYAHGGGKNPPHKVTTTVTVVDGAGAPVSGATVAIEVTSPEGNLYAASGQTGSDGAVSITVQQRGGGHGTWQSCVTSVSGTGLSYDPAANAETCETLLVS